MRLEVLFFKQTSPLNCGPTSLQMVLSYLGTDYDISFLEQQTEIREGKALFTIELALAAKRLGFKTSFYSSSLQLDPTLLELDYYKQHGTMTADRCSQLIIACRQEEVHLQEISLPLESILQFVSPDSVPIALVNWNIIRSSPEKGYLGHFVPIVGYDDQFVYVHDPGTSHPQPFVLVQRAVFDEARKAKGTDEDLVVIYRPKK